ncbi:lysozyme [Cupriavidus sp. USMAHM13]|uniref:Lysozyme n=1 Tax=Cupriavidus malaysiensis TaxID=367825 RepID=A0ABM6FEN3_9BURK|nr:MULTISPECIES: lysozyme [Cupriavidus]AOZ02270.1 lysozyme [Cupriavidus sp. USMAHM13]AOZ10352.1 lysozyme [Cupriavidus malaysiensis]
MALPQRVTLALGSGALALAAAAVALFEGYRPAAYLDPVGIATICYGHTDGVRLGQRRSEAECEALLRADLGKALGAVDRLVAVPLPETRRAALASFVYNVGPEAFAASTLLRKLNAGDVAGACDELPRWVLARGRVLPGLVERRRQERELCRM